MPWITLCLQKVYIVKTISCQSLLLKRVNIRIFQENIKDLKHSWKGIKKVISSITLIMLF